MVIPAIAPQCALAALALAFISQDGELFARFQAFAMEGLTEEKQEHMLQLTMADLEDTCNLFMALTVKAGE